MAAASTTAAALDATSPRQADGGGSTSGSESESGSEYTGESDTDEEEDAANAAARLKPPPARLPKGAAGAARRGRGGVPTAARVRSASGGPARYVPLSATSTEKLLVV